MDFEKDLNIEKRIGEAKSAKTKDIRNDSLSPQSQKFPSKKPVPQRGVFTESARKERLEFLSEQTNSNLDSMKEIRTSAKSFRGNIEGLIGAVEIPVGAAGPLRIQGENWSDEVYAPIATSEGALVSSINRGARALSMSGGVKTYTIKKCMTRAPVFHCKDIKSAKILKNWIEENFKALQEKVREYSNYVRLTQLEFRHAAASLHVGFYFETGDASGQNMTTVCTSQACQWIRQNFEKLNPNVVHSFMLECNLSTDKKVSHHSVFMGRGSEVLAEALLPASVIRRVFRCTSKEMADYLHKSQSAQMHHGLIGFNINVANVIAGVFTATGQDIACVHESSIAQFYLELRGEDLYASMHLPNLVVGSIGGGTGLPIQKQMLELMNCFGKDRVNRLAETIAAYCLALDLSTGAALVNGSFASAHEKWGRNRHQDWMRRNELNIHFLNRLINPKSGVGQISSVISSKSIKGESLVIDLASQVTSRLCGLWNFEVKTEKSNESIFIKSKVMDQEIISATEMMAFSCGQKLGSLLEKYREYSPFKKCHTKEIYLSELDSPSLESVRPKTLGTLIDHEREIFTLAQESVAGAELLDCVDERQNWTFKHLKQATRDIARVHSEFSSKVKEIEVAEWIGNIPAAQVLVDLKPLWKELAIYIFEEYPEIASDDEKLKHLQIINSVNSWSFNLDKGTKTLIHNDFNTRNMAFQHDHGNLRTVIFDWELATIHLPQRDLVELLCFSLTESFDIRSVKDLIEFHRQEFNSNVKTEYQASPEVWFEGFRYSLYDFLIYRLSIYSIAQQHRPCSFFEPTYQMAHTLIKVCDNGSLS